MLGLAFRTVPAELEERRAPGESARRYVERLAREKAERVAELRRDQGSGECTGAGAEPLIVAGDTVVELDGAVLEKPADAARARAMLSALSGREHRVYTGLALSRGCRTVSCVASARVVFRSLSPALVSAYVATGEPMDKAGAYGIQGCGSALVERVEGDYYAVVGFPVAAFASLLPELGLEYLPGEVVERPVVEGPAVEQRP